MTPRRRIPVFVLLLLAALTWGCGPKGEGANPGECSDGIDNDGDLTIDCVDFDCAADPDCTEPPSPTPVPTPTPRPTPTPPDCDEPTAVTTPVPSPNDPGPCNPAVQTCNNPTEFQVAGEFEVRDDCDGTFSVLGTFQANLTRNQGQTLECIQRADFDADLDTSGVHPCPDAGSGSCVGRLVNVNMHANSYSSGCALQNPQNFFTLDLMQTWIEGLMMSAPIDASVGLGPYCNGCTTLTVGDIAAGLPQGTRATHTLWLEQQPGSIMIFGLLLTTEPEGEAEEERLGIGDNVLSPFWIWNVN